MLVGVGCSPTLPERLASTDNLTGIQSDLNGVQVAVYHDSGMSAQSALATGRAFQWMGVNVEIVNGDCIKRGCLDKYNILIWPGGESRPNPWKELGQAGKSRIRDFVISGGGFVGICFGAGYASDGWDYWGEQLYMEQKESYLGLFDGVAHSGQVEIADRGSYALMAGITLSDVAGVTSVNLPQQMKVVYYPDSLYFEPQNETTVIILARYDVTGNPAMIAIEYGEGRVFLSGPHPEIETDSSRDGSPPDVRLPDEGSEWPHLLEIAKWLIAR
jgi:glutamine amidotransferase-like uncharacterized protein